MIMIIKKSIAYKEKQAMNVYDLKAYINIQFSD